MRTLFRRITSVVLMLTVIFSFSACFAEESEFPTLNFPQDSEDITEIIPGSPIYNNDSFHEITVALPLSEDTVNYLMKLYYAKQNGLFPEEQSGFDISLEYLNAISTTWVVNTITTTGEGESYSNLQSLGDSSSIPDLFLTPEIRLLADSGVIEPLDSYLADNSILSSSIYLGTLNPLFINDCYMGLPFYSTVMMIAGNSEFIPDEGIPPFAMNTVELQDYVDSIPNDSDITPVYNPELINAYLGGDYFVTNEDTSVDSRLSRSCGIWLMNSGEFNTWNSYYPDSLYFTMLPTENVYATVYPICVSSNSSEKAFSAEFACFICFDRDAQMLINRLENHNGYFPCISSPGVWEILSSDAEFGSQATLYEQFMNSSIYRLPEDS